MYIEKKDLDSIVNVRCSQPHDFLGMHQRQQGDRPVLVVRVYLDDAQSCEVIDLQQTGRSYRLNRLTEDGFFEGEITERSEVFAYRLRTQRYNGEYREFYDPYQFLPTMDDLSLHLFNQGNDHQCYRKLGARLCEVGGIAGVAFTVWAPSAQRVSVVGDFNHWNGRYHPMRSLGASGVWELFVPGVEQGAHYKFEIHGGEGYPQLKTDPYATYFESPPHNASIVFDIDQYQWNDCAWLERRAKNDWRQQPISIYEVHLGSWKTMVEDGNRPFSYRELAPALVDYLKSMHYTHVEFMPLAEHPFDGSWGYQVTGFFAPTHRFGTPTDFMYLVDYLHQHGFGVLMDWVPAHFPKDGFALAKFDGSCLYEHADPRQGEHADWGTLIFNYGRNEVRGFLIASALAWCERYHIDGLRVDAVASMLYLDYSRNEGEWVPNRYGGRENLEAIDFIRQTNKLVHQYHPGVMMIAEESTSFAGVTKPVAEGGLGFDLKWNMGWMNDTLEYFQKDPVYRKYEHHHLSFGMLYQYSENFTQVFSHDEVVHGKASLLLKMPGESIAEKAHQLRLLLAYMWAWPGKKTLFMGCDFGQSAEWQHDKSLDWHLLQYPDHQGVQALVRDLNLLYQSIASLVEGDTQASGFEWINCSDADSSVLSFLRKGSLQTDTIAVMGNYTPVMRGHYRIGVPYAGYWQEILNTDSTVYGGLGNGNKGGMMAEAIACDGRPYSIAVELPAQAMLWFRYQG